MSLVQVSCELQQVVVAQNFVLPLERVFLCSSGVFNPSVLCVPAKILQKCFSRLSGVYYARAGLSSSGLFGARAAV